MPNKNKDLIIYGGIGLGILLILIIIIIVIKKKNKKSKNNPNVNPVQNPMGNQTNQNYQNQILTNEQVMQNQQVANFETPSNLNQNQINKIIGNIYEKITMNSNIEIIYKSDYDNLTEQQIKDLYNKMLKKDLTLGKTNFGIHTDDIQFVLNGLDLKDYGSEGQQKNAVISYKFCELEILYEKLKVYPLLILDDIFSELDEEKIKNIFLILNNNIQTFITTTDLKLIDIQNFDNYKKFCVSSGILKEEEEYER